MRARRGIIGGPGPLARKAGICYASVAMIADYDSRHPDRREVDMGAILEKP